MGYPMTYRRVIHRNNLDGDYEGETSLSLLKGDLRRLEADQLDGNHLVKYAEHASITPAQAKLVLTMFFEPAIRGPT